MDNLTHKKNEGYLPSCDGGLDITAAQERFSSAYVKAMCAAAKVNYSELKTDDSSIDIEFRGRNFNGAWNNPRVMAQLKCTSNSSYIDMKKQVMKFPLSIKNYDDLRNVNDLPMILIVVFCPVDNKAWVNWAALETRFRFSGYWLKLQGMQETKNKTSVTVEVPFEQKFNNITLLDILNRISNGGW